MAPTMNHLHLLRAQLDEVFARDTAAPSCEWTGGSRGHCAAVAVLVNLLYGGEFVSAVVNGESHWFNRLTVDAGTLVDVDLTGDQFGFPKVRMTTPGAMYDGTRVRGSGDLRQETIDRALLLSHRISTQPTTTERGGDT